MTLTWILWALHSNIILLPTQIVSLEEHIISLLFNSCIFTDKTILWLYVFILKSIPSNAESGSESEDSNHNKNMVKTTTAIVEPKRKLSKRISKTNMKIEKSSPKQTNFNINQIEEISKKSKQLIFIFVVTFYLR